MDIFDPAEISDAFTRGQYERLLRRGISTGDAVHRAYGGKRKTIKMVYVRRHEFNAFVTSDSEHYYVQMTSGVPVLLIILFNKLFENPILLPDLNTDGVTVTDVSLPFIVDPAHIDQQKNWQLNLNADRAIAADFFADICMTFVVNHEIGHILSGHVEGARHYDGLRSYAEMTSYRPKSLKARRRRQAWEVDADLIASTLLMNYLRELDKHVRTHEHTRNAFFRGDDTFIHLLSSTVAALMAFFSYVRGARYQLNLNSSHPHPMVRALYIKDALFHAARRQWSFDEEKFTTLMDDSLEEMLTALHELGLSDSWRFTEEYFEQVNQSRANTNRLQVEHRESCEPWSWINWFGKKETSLPEPPDATS